MAERVTRYTPDDIARLAYELDDARMTMTHDPVSRLPGAIAANAVAALLQSADSVTSLTTRADRAERIVAGMRAWLSYKYPSKVGPRLQDSTAKLVLAELDRLEAQERAR